ncbi:MAG TPA: serine hydrolase domain-containing protein [Blastocatellia bacterium]|nr:serine hydrolase domain-containing protein [Blastocatellia bacterium]
MKPSMLRRRRSALTPVLSISLTLAIALPAFAQRQDSGATLNAQVDKVFAQYDKPDSPGCALAVIRDGAVIYKHGYGMADLDHDIPITPSTVFHVASVSKQFTAMAIMLLAKEGMISLDDPVRKYVPELRDFAAPVTIRHLLHHTSGLRDQWNLLIMAGWRLSEDVVRDDDILDLVSRMKALNFKPGDQHLYCNTGYTLLALIVKRVTGQSLRDYAETFIFKPLGMSRTFFRDDHTVTVKQQAYAFQSGPNNSFKLSVPNYDTVGASSLLTTVEDLARWDQNFYDKRVGGQQVIEQMQTTGTLNDGEKIDYAFGLAVGKYRGLKIVEHGGADAGYRSDLLRFPEQRFSVACLCNLGSTNPGQLARKVADIWLAGQLAPEAPERKQGESAITLTEEEMKSKVGSYWNARTEDLARVSINQGRLYLSIPGYNRALTPLGSNRFQMTDQPGEVTFESPAGGGSGQMIIKAEGRKPIIFDAMPAASPTTAQLAEYEGNYYSDELDATYRVALKDDRLVVMRRKYNPTPLAPVFRDGFTTLSILGHVRFTRDEGQRVNGFIISAGRIRGLRFVRQAQ